MPERPTVLLHLSDIHFRHGRSGTAHDLDADLRDQVEKSAVELRQKLNVIHGIVVSGDIAFSGSEDEYSIATGWLDKLCQKLGCSMENVWVVPGNHDVQRDVIKGSRTLQLLHRDLRYGPPKELDDKLRAYLVEWTPRLFVSLDSRPR